MPSGTCERCAAARNWLHKHHLKLQCEGGKDADGVLMICANCHEDVHGGPMGGDSVRHRRHTPEINARRAEAMRRRWEDPEYRAQMGQRTSRPKLNDAEKVALSELRRQQWADPEYRAKHAAARVKANEKRAKTMRAKIAERTPEQRAEHARKISEAKRRAT